MTRLALALLPLSVCVAERTYAQTSLVQPSVASVQPNDYGVDACGYVGRADRMPAASISRRPS